MEEDFNNINKKKNLIKSIYYKFLGKKITEGRICYSRTISNFKNININTESFFINESVKEKKLGTFIFEEKIGEGTFGKVILAKDQITKEKVAIKILEKEKILKETNTSKLKREIDILKLLRHNNIVHLYNVIETETDLYLIMEYIKGIELFDYINKYHYLSESEACKFYQQIVSGIEYLGKLKVVHRDLKPENLLITNHDTIKIVDFGLSNTYFDDNLLSTACGSPCYAAPEMIKGQKYSGASVDIWSSGVVLYAMLCGSLPFEDDDNDKLYKKITGGNFEIPNFLSDYASDFLKCILNVDPNKRYNIEQIKKHPWFNQLNQKINMSEGLLIKSVVTPIDENIISIMVNKYMFNEEEIKINLLLNELNQVTTTYYLILQKFIKEGKKTIGDMKSDIFLNYIHDSKNQLSFYNNDFNSIINERVYGRNSEEKKRIKQKSERKNIKPHYFIDNVIINIKSKNNKGDSISVNKNKTIDVNKGKSPNSKKCLTYLNYTNKRKKTDFKEEKIRQKLLNKIYIKKFSKENSNFVNNNLSLSFFIKRNKIAKDTSISKNENITLNQSDKNINKTSFIKSKSKKKKNIIYNSINLRKKKEIMNNINNNIDKLKTQNKNLELDNILKFSYNSRLLSSAKIDAKYKNNSSSKKKRLINPNNNIKIDNNDVLKTESMISNYKNFIAKYSSFNKKGKIFTYRREKINILSDKKNNPNKYTIKVDKKNLCFNSNNSFTKEFLYFQNNKIKYACKKENQKQNDKIIRYSKKIYKRNSEKKNIENSSNGFFHIANLNKFDNDSEIINIEQKNFDVKKYNFTEERNIYKKIKIQKSPFIRNSKYSNDEKIYYKKQLFFKKNNNKNLSKKLFDTSTNFYKSKENEMLIENYSTNLKKKNESANKVIEIREDYNNINYSKAMSNKPNKLLKINIINNFSNIDTGDKNKKQNMNINTLQPQKKISDYFQKNIKKKKINNDNIKESTLIKTSLDKKNLISIYSNLNTLLVNKYYNNDKNNKYKLNGNTKNIKNENCILKNPQLCITNINLYNYVQNVHPLQNVNKEKQSKTNDKIEITLNKELLNNYNIKLINYLNQGIKFEDTKSKNYIPFDLNSIILLNKSNNIKNIIIKNLKMKKINYRINNTDYGFKFICNKNDNRFEINISNHEEKKTKKLILINSIKKQGNTNNFKNILNQLIILIK